MIQQEQRQLINLLNQKEQPVKVDDITILLNAVDRLIQEGTTKEVKQIYQCLIKEITFNKETKADIQMTLYFDETIVNQLNKSYQGAISQGDMALFVLETPIKIEL